MLGGCSGICGVGVNRCFFSGSGRDTQQLS